MKKSKLLLVLSCVGLLGLSACNNDAPTSSSAEPTPVTPTTTTDFAFGGESVLNDKILQNNSLEKDEVKNKKVKNTTLSAEQETFKNENISSYNYASKGLLVVQNDEGYVGFYSLLQQKWLIKPTFEKGKFTYQVKTLDYLGFMIEIHYRDAYLIIDSFGNIFGDGETPYTANAEYYKDVYTDLEGEEVVNYRRLDDLQGNYYFATRYINKKVILLIPFVEKVVTEEPTGEFEKDDEGHYKTDEDGNYIEKMEKVTTTYKTAYFYEYDDKGNATLLKNCSDWPEVEEEEPEEEEEEETLGLNDFFNGGLTDLTPNGLPGYYLARSGNLGDVSGAIYTIYDASGAMKSSFTVQAETGHHPMIQEFGIIGNKMIFQSFEQVANDAEEYDVFIRDQEPGVLDRHSGAKYVGKSFTINLEDGKRNDFETDYYFTSKVTPINGAVSGEYYYTVTFATIAEDKTLNASQTYIVDKDFKVRDNITGLSIDEDSLKQLQDGKYFDMDNKIVYSNEMKPIAHLNAINNLQYLPEHNVFYGRYDGKYGLVSTSGKVMAVFEYDAIAVAAGIDGYFIARKGNEYYLIGHGEQEACIYNLKANEYHVDLDEISENGLICLSYYKNTKPNDVTYLIFDAQCMSDGLFEPLAQIDPEEIEKVDLLKFNKYSKQYYHEEEEVTTSYGQFVPVEQILGKYTFVITVKANNDYEIKRVPVLDNQEKPVLDINGNPAYDQEVEEEWFTKSSTVTRSDLAFRSYDSGEEILAEYKAAKDLDTAYELAVGENELLRREDGAAFVKFSPEEDGPYLFTANKEMNLNNAMVNDVWYEDPEVVSLFAQYGEDKDLRIKNGKLTLELELAKVASEDPAAEPTYTAKTVDLANLILHKIYNDKNEKQDAYVNSHMAITLEDVTVFEWLEVENPDAEPGEAPDYDWFKVENTALSISALGTRKFKVALTESYDEDKKEYDICFLLDTVATEAPEAPAQQQQQQQNEQEEDQEPEFHMVTKLEDMFQTKRVDYYTMTKVKDIYEEDEDGEKVIVAVQYKFGDNYVGEGEEHEGEWGEGMLKAGHEYYFSFSSSKQVNNILVEKSHIHKVNKWLMADIVVPTGELTALTSGSKFGICEIGEEAIVRDVTLKRGDELTAEEIAAWKEVLGKDMTKTYAVALNSYYYNKYNATKQTWEDISSGGTILVLEDLFDDEYIAEYNENKSAKSPAMVEGTAEQLLANVLSERLTVAKLDKFLGTEGTEYSETDIRWDTVQVRYLYDSDLDYEEAVPDSEEKVTKHTKSYFTIGAYDAETDTVFVGIYNDEGVLLWGQVQEDEMTIQQGAYEKNSVYINMFYTSEFASVLMEQLENA